MKLQPIDNSKIELVTEWLSEKENYQWIDFGSGQRIISPLVLKVMTQKDTQLLRVFTADSDDTPIGLVALSDIDLNFKTAMLWFVLGNKQYASKGYSTRAVAQILTIGFQELALQSVHAWAVDENIPSIRVIEGNNFQLVGRRRQCHYIEGRPCDRLLFDILASEHQENQHPLIRSKL